MLRRRLKGVAVLAALAIFVIALGGCGGTSQSEISVAQSELPGFAPADAAVYVEATVRPDGALKDDIDGILGKFPGGDRLGATLVDGIDSSLSDIGLNYAEDVEPWLGRRAAFFVSAEGTASGAGLIEATDEGKATETLRAALEGQGTISESSVGPTTVYSTAEDSAFAVFDGVAAVGTKLGVMAAISARDGQSFADTGTEYVAYVGDAGDGLVAGAYLDLGPLIDLSVRQGDTSKQEADAARKLLGGAAREPILAAATVESDKVALEFAGATGSGGGVAAEPGLIEDVPDQAWAVLAFSDVGGALRGLLSQISGLGSVGDLAQAESQLRAELGIGFDDLESLGDVAIFAGGTSLIELKVGAVIENSDKGSRDRLLAGIRKALRQDKANTIRPLGVKGAEGFSLIPEGFPVPINFATANDRIVIAAGDETTSQLLEGGGSFTGSDVYGRASGALGDGFGVNFLLDLAPLIELIEGLGQGGSGFEEVRQYLEPIDLVAAGSSSGGDRDAFRIVVTFK